MKQTLIILGLCLLSSCQIYKSDFDCPHSPGLGCVPVSHVNDLIDRGELSDSKALRQKTQELNTNSTQKSKEDKKNKELKVIFYKSKNTVTRVLRVEDRQ